MKTGRLRVKLKQLEKQQNKLGQSRRNILSTILKRKLRMTEPIKKYKGCFLNK